MLLLTILIKIYRTGLFLPYVTKQYYMENLGAGGEGDGNNVQILRQGDYVPRSGK